jgi:hypothetical protein
VVVASLGDLGGAIGATLLVAGAVEDTASAPGRASARR